jgi:hypothetical protein
MRSIRGRALSNAKSATKIIPCQNFHEENRVLNRLTFFLVGANGLSLFRPLLLEDLAPLV